MADEEFDGALVSQAHLLLKHWQYFPECVQRDLSCLIKYLVKTRAFNSQSKQFDIQQSQVSDHVYEM